MQHMPRFAPPPRRVPISLVLTNFFNGASQFGWFLFGFGMIFFWIFGAEADLSFAGMRSLASARGQVTQVESTNASENEQRVYAHYYAFSIAGQRHTGVSYVTGNGASVGQDVEIEYDAKDPSWSRIAGMRRSTFGPWAMVVVIFPAIGLGIAFFAMRAGMRRARLLRDGYFTTGKLIAKEGTSVRVNKQPVFELTFEFTGRDGRKHQAKTRTHQTFSLEDEPHEPLLYDPENPTVAYLLDEVPSRPRLDGMGELLGRPVVALLALVIPLVVIGANVLFVLRKIG